MLIGSTSSSRLAETATSIVQAGRLARALGTTFAEIFEEIEREVGSS
jgi:hypothetical protein